MHAYVEHYHGERNRQGKGNILLFPRVTKALGEGPVQCRGRLGGLLRYYHEAALLDGLRPRDNHRDGVTAIARPFHASLTLAPVGSHRLLLARNLL